MYHKMQTELSEVKDTLRLATQNENSYKIWLEKRREEAADYRHEIAHFINLFETFPSIDVMANSRFVERVRELLKKYSSSGVE